MTAAKNSFGNKVWIALSGQTLVAVADLLSVTPLETTRDTIGATTMDSPGGAMEVITSGVYDPGDMTFTVHDVAGSAFDLAARAAITTGAKQDVRYRSKSAAGMVDETFTGYVTAYSRNAQVVDGKQEATLSLKATGVVTAAATV